MNLWTLRIVRLFTNLGAVFSVALFVGLPAEGWDVDFSRRAKQTENKMVEELRWPSGMKTAEELFADRPMNEIFQSVEPAQSIVVLNTDNGFIPDTIRLRKDANYKIFIANVNSQFKNASFILDSFGQTHGTFFGQPKSFDLIAKATGVFTFLCPETGAQGKFIVISDKDASPPVAALKKEVKK